ncbi:MAG: PIN domain-containing protein [Chloroflexi bacterium]|nr:PIN domain-containing protein [Chloroflexota bacterium]
MVIVDSSVWIQAFRVSDSPEHHALQRLLEQEEVVMVGIILAEVLQGSRNPSEFEEIRLRLSELPYVSESKDTWTHVGALSYQLRQDGLTMGLVDLLIAALATEHRHQLYTLDQHFQRVPGLKLYQGGI